MIKHSVYEASHYVFFYVLSPNIIPITVIKHSQCYFLVLV